MYIYGCFSFVLILAFIEGGDPAQGGHAGPGVVGPSLGRWWALVGLSPGRWWGLHWARKR